MGCGGLSADAELVVFDVVHDDPEIVRFVDALHDAAAGGDESVGLGFDACPAFVSG
jgi:hypothetical protein